MSPTAQPGGIGTAGTPTGAIRGVVSTSKESSLRVWKGRTQYDQWEVSIEDITPRVFGAQTPQPGQNQRPGGPGQSRPGTDGARTVALATAGQSVRRHDQAVGVAPARRRRQAEAVGRPHAQRERQGNRGEHPAAGDGSVNPMTQGSSIAPPQPIADTADTANAARSANRCVTTPNIDG